jgi:hypothetical protein
MHLRGPKGQLKVSPQSGARAGSLPSCAAEQPGKVCLAHSEQTNISSLKVHKIENFFDYDFGICVISLLVMSKY